MFISVSCTEMEIVVPSVSVIHCRLQTNINSMILWLFIVDVVVSIVSVLNLVERWGNRNYEEGKA